jgi:hypothetical protein
LWDAGTEKMKKLESDQIRDHAKKGPNTGEAERGVVHRVNDARWAGSNTEFFRIKITPAGGMQAMKANTRIAFITLIFLSTAVLANAQTVQKTTLTIDGAKRVIAGAVAYAKKNNAPGGVIAVVDEGGNLMALERLDGTFAAGANISIGKARQQCFSNDRRKRLKTSYSGDIVVVSCGAVNSAALLLRSAN